MKEHNSAFSAVFISLVKALSQLIGLSQRAVARFGQGIAFVAKFLFKWSIYQIVLSMVGFLSIIAGVFLAYRTQMQAPRLVYQPMDEELRKQLLERLDSSSDSPEATASAETQIWVEVAGAVEKPGVYALYRQARLQDVLLQAGGFLENANFSYVHRELPLARRLVDQEKIYIPFKTEGVSQTPVISSANPVEAGKSQQPVSARSLATATAAQLQEIDGIGEKRAEDILANRPYQTWEELREKTGLSHNILKSVQEIYTLE